MPTNDGLKYESIIKLLQQYGIDPRRATSAATSELEDWDTSDIQAILKQVDNDKKNYNPCAPEFNQHREIGIGLKVGLYTAIGSIIAIALPIFIVHSILRLFRQRKLSVFLNTWKEYQLAKLIHIVSQMDDYIKAPIKLVRQSIEHNAALCVNKDGRFAVMTSGYSVMSYVWEETMGWNSPKGFGKVDLSVRKKGIHRAHFQKFFDKCKAKWLWVDVLAMPEVLEDISPQEKDETEALRVAIINNFPTILRNADKAVVLDSLMMRTQTASLIDAAVIMCLGRWRSRMWTLTEARLATRVFVMTRDKAFDLDEIIALLKQVSIGTIHRYACLMRTLSTIRGRADLQTAHEIGSVVELYRNARTGHDIDRVRAAFPLLGLFWRAGWSRTDGMMHLIHERPQEAAILCSLAGERDQLEPFGWCPNAFNLLRGTSSHSLLVVNEGIEGRWNMAVVCKISSTNGLGTLKEPYDAAITTKSEDTDLETSIPAQILTTHVPPFLDEASNQSRLFVLWPESSASMFNFLLVVSDEKLKTKEKYKVNKGTVVGSGLLDVAKGTNIELEGGVASWALR